MKLEDYRNEYGEWMRTGTVAGKQYLTVGGSYWNNMTQRCKVGGSVQRSNPSYFGCEYTWTSCSEFIEWARQQVGYGTGQLDKDILLKGNKIYCPELCVFVPQAVNILLIKRDVDRGEWPIGVCWDKENGRFKAQLSINGKHKHLGLFNTPEAAFAAYKQAKEAEIKRVVVLYKDYINPRVYDALMSYTVEVDD